MRVLVALSQPPAPEGGAPGRCALALLRGLQSHGVGVRAVAAVRSADVTAVPADVDVTLVATTEPLSRGRLYLAKTQWPRGELGRGAFDSAVAAAASAADLLHLEELDTGWTARRAVLPRVLHVHYLAHLDQSMAGLGGRDPLRGAEEVYGELRLARAHRWMVASSPVVAARLRQISPRSEVVVAPLSLDPAYYPAAPLDGPPLAGLIGTAAWPPTRSAVRRLVRRVWPAVSKRVPAARLQLAGRGMTPQAAGAVGATGVDVMGEVTSAAEFLCGLSVLAYPVARGSGMKVKVMEALASGVPVVTTPQGAEGIGENDGVVVSTDDDDLVAALADLLADPVARRQRGSAGRDHFRRHLAPVPATAPLADLYARVLGG